MSDTAELRIGGETTKAIPKRIVFTVAALDKLACPPDRDRMYVYDRKVLGLTVCTTRTGTQSFFVLRKIDGKTERIRLGGRELTIDQVRKLAARVNASVADGKNPQEAKRVLRESDSIGELFDEWSADLKARDASPKTLITDKSRFDTCCESIKNRKALSITEHDIRSMHRRIGRDIGHVSANRAVQLLRRMFNWARIPNPVQRGSVDFFPEKSRKRRLDAEEVARLFQVLDHQAISPLVRDFVKLCLFTGQRRSNVSAMKVSDLDLQGKVWTIPGSESKNHDPIPVHLSEPALEVIRQRLGDPSGFIFPGDGRDGHFTEPRWTWTRIREIANLQDVTIHDLRRTFASFLGDLNTSAAIISDALGHKDPRSAKIYTRIGATARAQSVDAATAVMLQGTQGAK